MPESVAEFSKRIKAKYPEYADIDDLELVTKIVTKYPEYKDKVTFEQPAAVESTGTLKKVGKGAFDTAAFIGAVASMPSEVLQGRWRTAFENIKEKGDQAPLEDISNVLAAATIAYGGVQGLKAVPELARLAKNPSLIKSVFGIAPKPGKALIVSDIPSLKMTDAEMVEFYKKAPEGVQKAMAVHNPQMRKILQTGIGPVAAPAQKPPPRAPTAVPGVVAPAVSPKVTPAATPAPVPIATKKQEIIIPDGGILSDTKPPGAVGLIVGLKGESIWFTDRKKFEAYSKSVTPQATTLKPIKKEYKGIKEIWDAYSDTGELSQDRAIDEIESILELEKGDTSSIRKSIDEYRESVDVDRFEYGMRSDLPERAYEKFEKAVEAYISKSGHKQSKEYIFKDLVWKRPDIPNTKFEILPPKTQGNQGTQWEAGVRVGGFAQDVKKFTSKKKAVEYLDKWEPKAPTVPPTPIAAKPTEIPAKPVPPEVLKDYPELAKTPQPETPISKPEDIVELGSGPFPPKQLRDALNSALPAEEKVNALGQVVKFYLGTKKERFQVIAGSVEKGNAWYNAVRRMDANRKSIEAQVEARNREIFKGLPLTARKYAHDIAKGISKNANGEIVGGGIQPAGTIKADLRTAAGRAIGPGTVLKDGRIVGDALEEGGREYQTYRKFNTLENYKEIISKYPQTKILFDKLLALRETVGKTKLGEDLPAFAREVMKEQYKIKTVHPQDYRWVPSIRPEERFFTKIGNLFKSYTASSRKYKTGILAETGQEDKDLLKTLTAKQNEIAFENLFNNTVGDILATILEPIGKGGVKPGFVDVNLNKPKLARILELKKDVLLANGIDYENISTYQYPMNVDKEFNLSRTAKFSPEMQAVVDGIANRTNQIVGFILSNYLIRLSTAIRNASSGFVQYNLRTLTHLNEGMMGKGFMPAVNDVKALARALKPEVVRELPKEILGLNFYSEIPENVKIMDKALIPFRAVESYFKRASFDADLNTFAGAKFAEALKSGAVKPTDRQKFIQDYRTNYFQDLFNTMADNSDSVTFDYGNKPWFLEKMSNTIGRGFVPYPNYMYHKWRMYAEYSPLQLAGMNKSNYKNKIAKALAGIQMFTIMAAIADKVVEDRKEKLKELELKKLPWEFDTTGRIKVYADDTVERWLRIYDLPYIGDTVYLMEIMQKQAGVDDWFRDSLAMGPIFNTMALFMGLRTKYTTGLAAATVAGQQTTGFIPFGAYMQYLRILADPVKRQTYSKDYNAFQNFMSPVINVVPGMSAGLPAQVGRTGMERGQIRKYDIPAETMKLFFLNIRSIDKKEYMQYMHEQFREGKVRSRIEKEARKSYAR